MDTTNSLKSLAEKEREHMDLLLDDDEISEDVITSFKSYADIVNATTVSRAQKTVEDTCDKIGASIGGKIGEIISAGLKEHSLARTPDALKPNPPQDAVSDSESSEEFEPRFTDLSERSAPMFVEIAQPFEGPPSDSTHLKKLWNEIKDLDEPSEYRSASFWHASKETNLGPTHFEELLLEIKDQRLNERVSGTDYHRLVKLIPIALYIGGPFAGPLSTQNFTHTDLVRAIQYAEAKRELSVPYDDEVVSTILGYKGDFVDPNDVFGETMLEMLRNWTLMFLD